MGEIVLVILLFSVANAFLSRTRSAQANKSSKEKRANPKSKPKIQAKRQRKSVVNPIESNKKKTSQWIKPSSKSVQSPKADKLTKKDKDEVQAFVIRNRTMKKSRYADRHIDIKVEDLSNKSKAKIKPSLGFGSSDVINGVIWKELLDRRSL